MTASATTQITATIEFDEDGDPVRLVVPSVGFDSEFLLEITVDGVVYDLSGGGDVPRNAETGEPIEDLRFADMPDEVATMVDKIGAMEGDLPTDIVSGGSPCCDEEVTSTRICQGCGDIVEIRNG